MALTGKERRQLRALGHHLSPVVQVGQGGVTKGVISAVNQALEDHELVKVKVGEGPEDRHDAADALARATKSEVAQVLGKTILLFRKRAKKSKFEKLGQPGAEKKVGAAAGKPAGKKAAARPATKKSRQKPSAEALLAETLPEDTDLDEEEELDEETLSEDHDEE